MPPRKKKLTPRLAERICLLILEGKSLLAISKIPGMPSLATLNRWIAEDAEFRSAIQGCRDIECSDLMKQATELLQAVPDSGEDADHLLKKAKEIAASMRAEALRKQPRKEWDRD